MLFSPLTHRKRDAQTPFTCTVLLSLIFGYSFSFKWFHYIVGTHIHEDLADLFSLGFDDETFFGLDHHSTFCIRYWLTVWAKAGFLHVAEYWGYFRRHFAIF